MTKSDAASKNKSAVSGTQSLDRGLGLLFQIASSPPPGLSLAACTEIMDYSKATTLRMLQTLTHRGLLSYDAELGVYSLGGSTIRLGAEYLRRTDIRKQALPHMQELVEATHETAHLGVLREENVVYIELVETPDPVRIFSRIGDAIPAYATATGKAILAWLDPETLRRHLPEVLTPRTPQTLTDIDELLEDLRVTRSRGYAVDTTENRENVRGFAAPIFDHNDEVIAAVSIGGHSERITDDVKRALIEEVQRAARSISLELGATSRWFRTDETVS